MTLTSEEVDELAQRHPTVRVQEAAEQPGYWTWLDPSGFRRYRRRDWPIPALHHERPARLPRADGRDHDGRGLIILLPPEE